MNGIERSIRWTMLASGVLTSTMLYAAVWPAAALRSTFGEELSGPVAELLIRNWGVLVTLIGVALIHGALNSRTRRIALMLAVTSKAVFIGLVLSNGARFLGHGAGAAVVLDGVMIVLFMAYLITTSEPAPAHVSECRR